MTKIFFNHIIPICLSIIIVFGGLIIINKVTENNNQIDDLIIEGKQNKQRGRYTNFTGEGNEDELDFMASMANTNQLTLFGSSEFCDLASVTYNFFPDSLNRPILGIGHAYHQQLSILIELLAAHEFNEKSEICIFVSPGWFSHNGTNTSAFIEYANKNLLSRIINDNSIPLKYKTYIGKYINTNMDNFESLSQEMELLNNLYKDNLNTIISKTNYFIKSIFLNNLINSPIQKVKYHPSLTYKEPKEWQGDFNQIAQVYQDSFVSKIKDNNIYVYDDYYNTYLLDDDGNPRKGSIAEVDLETNIEFKDFKMLLSYIKSRNMKASFVIIPLNPYYYKGTEKLAPLIDSLTTNLEQNDFPCLNMYVTDTLDYEPGTLKDVMHLGDYGWVKVNQFIDSIYYK